MWRNIRNFLERNEEQLTRYQNPDNDPEAHGVRALTEHAKSGSKDSAF